jgi:hypothetical protein
MKDGTPEEHGPINRITIRQSTQLREGCANKRAYTRRRDLHFVEALCGGGGGAVGGDVGPALRIAHRDRESAKVGAHHANFALRTAGEAQRVAFAGVRGVHPVFTHR